VKWIDQQREQYRDALALEGLEDMVAAAPVLAPRPQVRGGLKRWFRRRRGSTHPADLMAGTNVLALGDGAVWLWRSPKWKGPVPRIEELVGWWPIATIKLASSYKELQSYDYDTSTTYRTKVVQIGIKAQDDERLTVVIGLQNEQTREIVRAIKRATGQRKD
jgi:hypothetical protein